MDQLVDFLSRLGDTSDWPPRWHCGTWSDFHGWLYILSDLMIWLAYMCIPLVLVRFVLVKQGVPLKRVFWLFGAFILLCGLTHLVDVIIFWVPVYRISALVRLLAGVVSIGTVIALVRHFDDAVGLKTSQEYEYELGYRQRALHELERSNQELQQFAYVASHDLKSPLKTIEGYLGLIESRYGGQLDETGLKLLATTARSAGRMRLLIDDLLEFSQVGLAHDPEPVSMDEAVREALEEVGQEIIESGARLQVGDLPTLRASRTDIKRVFQNRVSNAIKYRRKGVAPLIRIAALERGTDWVFSVSDNGIGIEDAHFDRIFQVFQRLHGRDEYPGTGVGLAACKKVVESHHGRIWVSSRPGEGSVFSFSLPKDLKTVRDYVQHQGTATG